MAFVLQRAANIGVRSGAVTRRLVRAVAVVGPAGVVSMLTEN